MARDAFDALMRAIQFMLCVAVMLKGDLNPFSYDVAAITLGTEVSFVRIVIQMTGDAFQLQLIAEWIVVVAVFAGQVPVAAFERELRIPPMVEACVVPRFGIVASAAILSAPALVNVVCRMAGITVIRCSVERIIPVAVLARDIPVSAQQGIICSVVIKTDVGPGIRAVAVGANLAHDPIMCIVICVTGYALARRITMFRFRNMTAVALDLEVSTQQVKIGQFVIKCFLVQVNDIRVASFMIGVTIRTTGIRYVAR